MNITVLYNKPSDRFATDATHKAAEEDTEHSAKEVAAALTSKGAHVTLVSVTEHAIDIAVNGITADLVFNLIEWTGVDTQLALKVFDAMSARGLHYTGATKENYHDTCDKIITKRLCQRYGLPTAKWQEFKTRKETPEIDTYPVIVKVSNEHSSVGITKDAIAHNAQELADIVKRRIDEYHQPVFAETFLTGREFQVTLLEQEGLVVLPPAEIVYGKNTDVPLLTYESRWNERHSDYKNSDVELAKLTPFLLEKLTRMSQTAFTAFGFRNYARFDIRCDEHEIPYFLELNSNPGLGDDPDYGMTVSYKAAGMTFSDFVWKIVQSARRRVNKR
ncbi:MAG TPA: hypothetical protein VJB96_04245 [Patescibacteria group bacterium]|nr:hypothetical protein [Patescibacteria group bacterium]